MSYKDLEEAAEKVHDGENVIFGESAMLFCPGKDEEAENDEDLALEHDFGSTLHIKDVKGKTWIIYLPIDLVQSLMIHAYNAFIEKEKPSEKDFKYFLRDYKQYFNSEVNEEVLKELFFDSSVAVIRSNLRFLHVEDQAVLSSDIISE